MKLLIVSDSHLSGAGKAVGNLAKLLSREDYIQVRFITQAELSPFIALFQKFIAKLESIIRTLLVRDHDANYFSFWLFGAFNIQRYLSTHHHIDTVVVGWSNRSFLNFNHLSELTQRIIVRLSDDWFLTGGCHFTGDCLSFEENCQACPLIRVRLFGNRLHSLQAKEKLLCLPNLILVFPSHANLLKFQHKYPHMTYKSFHIPTPVNTDIFVPVVSPKNFKSLSAKLIFTFTASDPYADKRKNLIFLIDLFKILRSKVLPQYQLELHVLGGNLESIRQIYKVEGVIHHGYIESDHAKSQILSHSCLHFTPSHDDNLPNAALEALSCGCPLASHDVGGLREITHHGKNGFLFPRLEMDDWSDTIMFYILSIKTLHPLFSAYSRGLALSQFSNQAIVTKWSSLIFGK